MRLKRVLLGASGVAGVAALLVFAGSPAMADGSVCGSASALSANVSVLNRLDVGVPDLPSVDYPRGGDKSVASINGLITAHVLHASSNMKDDGKLHSHADIADVNVLGMIKASVLTSDCWANGNDVDGHSSIVDVKVGHLGTPLEHDITVTADHPINLNMAGDLVGQATDQTVTITFNEKLRKENSLTVNALHVHVGNGLLDALHLGGLVNADVVLSQATCTTGRVPSGPTTSPCPPTTTPAAPVTTTKAPGVVPVSHNGGLPYTGAGGLVPMTIGALALLAAGGGSLFWTMRRRRAAGSTGSDS